MYNVKVRWKYDTVEVYRLEKKKKKNDFINSSSVKERSDKVGLR